MNCLKEWKPINEFLEVSSDGEIKSHGRIIQGEICSNGYKRIHVSNPDKLPVVNHIDGNKQNNAVTNLEWCDYSYNLKHAYKAKLRSAFGEKNSQHKLTEKEVKEIRSLYIKGKKSERNSSGLAKRYNVNPKTILNIVNHKSWTNMI